MGGTPDALANPLLAYYLVKRISGPVAGLIAAGLVALCGYYVTNTFSLDAALLTLYLLSLLTLLAAIQRDSSLLAFLSGLFLGASILTKETAFVSLPSPCSRCCFTTGICAGRSGTI